MTGDGAGGNGGASFRAKAVLRPRAQVEEQIKDAILLGQFAQGEKLPPETQLAEQFGVSRPTVREALSALVSAGLIRKIPGNAGGSFINTVTPESLSKMLGESMDTIMRLGTLEITEVTHVRRFLEVPASRLAAGHRTEADVERLRGIVDRQRGTTIDDPDIPSYDRDFHTTIGNASGNRLLAAFVAALHDATHPAEFLNVTQDVANQTVKQHIAIVRAIDSGDADAAATAMEKHLDYVLQYSDSGGHPGCASEVG